ncbi:unnamed protein product [Ranitomeya imitator]|uniref:Uncharacterized protein n=1 Tax=Ranitomeya imitator TaxID=111125 RepID=A0ABN9KRY8_9NEOB|nr:unnamed protein product [Ranitomeya imitator]
MIMNDDVDSSSLQQLFKWKRKPKSESCRSLQRVSQICLQPFLHRQWKPPLCNIEMRNLQITATFAAGLFSNALYNNLVDSWQPRKLPRKCQVIKGCLAKAIQKHFDSIPPALKDEKKSMHAMPDFVWLIKCIYELQDMTLSVKAVQDLDVDHLKLTYCGIGPAECTALAYVLKHLKRAVGIQLDHNSVGDIGIEQLMPCLQKCRALYLRDNNITDKGLCRLMEQVPHWPNFQKIALFNNRLTDECMDSIAYMLKRKQNFLALSKGHRYRGVQEQSHHGSGASEGVKHFSKREEDNSMRPGLGAFHGPYIDQKGLDDHGSPDLNLQPNGQIRDCKFERGYIRGLSIASFRNAVDKPLMLVGLAHLRFWSLVGNNIGSVGGEALAGMLERNTALEELWLDDNKLQDSDAILIAESLKKNHTLKVLKFSNNGFSKTGVSALAEALKSNNIITAIWMKGNKLTTEEQETFEQLERLFVKG